MVDFFDSGFDGFDGLDGFGLDGTAFDAVGFDGLGFGFGGFEGLDGFDPAMAALDGMGMDGLGGFDLAGVDTSGLAFDFGFDTLGFGSDLDDVILGADVDQLVQLDLADPLEGGLTIDGVLDLDPQSLSGLDPSVAMGAGSFPSPFLSPDAGGVAMGGGMVMGGSVAAAGFGPGGLMPSDVLKTPTDSFQFPVRSAGRVVSKVARWFGSGDADSWLGTKSKQLADQLLMDAAADQVKKGGKAVLGAIRRASRAAG